MPPRLLILYPLSIPVAEIDNTVRYLRECRESGQDVVLSGCTICQLEGDRWRVVAECPESDPEANMPAIRELSDEDIDAMQRAHRAAMEAQEAPA